MLLKEFRQKYPQYDDVPDKELADALYRKFYSDKPIDEYYKQIGLSIGMPTEFAQPEPITGMESAFAPAPVESKPKPTKVKPIEEVTGAESAFVPTPPEIAERKTGIGSEFVKGVRGAAEYALPSLYQAAKTVPDVGMAATNMRLLDIYDKIDRGEINSEDLRGLGTVETTARSYLNTSPENRAKLKARASQQLEQRKDDIYSASMLIKQYQQEMQQKYGPDSAEFVESVTNPDPQKLANWAAYTAGSGAVQLVPLMLAAVTTGPVGVGAVGTSMGVGEAFQNRLQSLYGSLEGLTPREQADKITNYLKDTGDVSLAVGIFSGALDSLLGPAAAAAKFAAKKVVDRTSREALVAEAIKSAPRQMAEEGFTGGAQEAAQIAGKVRLGERDEFLTKETLIDIINAAASEAVGSLAGPAVGVGVAATKRLPKEGEPDVTVPYNRRPSPTLSGESIPIFGRREPTFTPEGAGRVEQPTVEEPPSAPVVPRGRKETQPNSLEIDRASLYPIIDELERYDPELAKYAREVVNDRSQRITQDDVDILTAQLNNAKAIEGKKPTSVIDITQNLEDKENAELESYMAEGTNEYAKSLITPEINKKLQNTLGLAKAALLNKQRAEDNLEEEIYFPSDYEDANKFIDNLSEVYLGLQNGKLAYAEQVVPILIKEAEVLSESLQQRVADDLNLKREKKSERIYQSGLTVVPRTEISTLPTTSKKETPSAPTPSETIKTEKKGPAAPAKGAEVATAAKPDPNAPFNEFEQQEYDLAQKLLQTPGGKSFGKGVLSRLQGPLRFTKPSTQQSVDFVAEKLKQYETPSQAESPSVTNTLRDTLRDNTQRERLILQQYETEMQREDAPANQILSQTNGVLARINDAIRQAGFMPYDGASIRTSAPSNIQALYKLASMISAGGYSILSQRLAQDKKYQAFSADKLKILFDRQNRDLTAANEALDKLAAPKEAAERTSEQILNEQKEVLAERNKLRTSRNRPPSGKSPARVKWDELTSRFDELTQELAKVSEKEKEKAAKTSKPRTLEQVAKERKDLTAQRNALLTSKGKVPAVRSPARRKYDRLTEEINKLYAEKLRLSPKNPVEAGVKDEVDIAREKRIAFLEGELDRANREIEELNKEPSEPLSDQQLYAKRQQIELLEERKAKLQDSLDKARVPRANIGGDFFDIAEAFMGPPLPEGYQPVQVAGIGVITDALNKNPSLRRAVAKYYKLLQAGKITAEEYAREVNRVYEETKQDKEPADLVRGQLNFRERLLRAERVGELPRGTLAFTEWFISLNPSLLNDVAISIRGPKEGRDEGVAGQYLPLPRIVRLLVGNLKRETVVHELLHHFERLMPEKLQSEIRELWLNSVIDKLNRSPYGSPQRTYLAFVHNHLLGKGSAVDLAAALSMIKNGQVPPSYYQYINPSEFWAVNATEIMLRRFGGTTSVINRIKQWLKELVAKVKDYFGLPSNAPLIRALDSLAKADGKYQSKSLLAKDVSGYYSFAGPKSIEYDPYDPQEIADDNARKEGNLKQAKDLEANGASPIEIWNKTGWWHDTIDGQWRYEINDSKAVFKADLWANPPDQQTTVGEILDHPELYKAYPELKNVVVFKRPAFLDFFQSMQGWLSKDGTITVTPHAKDPFSTLLHEIQHWIQRKEGFGPGGNAESMQIANNIDILELLKKRYEYLLDKARGVQGATQEDSWRIIAPEQTSVADLLKKLATVQAAIDGQFELSKAAAKRDSLGQKKTNLQNDLHKAIVEEPKNIRQEEENDVKAQIIPLREKITSLEREVANLTIDKLLLRDYAEIKRIENLISVKLVDKKLLSQQVDKIKESLSDKYKQAREKLDERKAELRKEIDQVDDKLTVAKKKYNDLEGALGAGADRASITTIKYDLYQMVSGEIEARNTEARLKMTEEERAQTPPSVTADIDAALAFLNTLAEEAAQAAPPGGPKKRARRYMGPISGKSKWRTVEETTRKLSDVLNDALKGRITWGRAVPQITKAVWESSNAALRKALLFAATLRQMADLTRYKFPQLLAAINIVDKMTSYRLKKLNEAQSIALDWQKAQNNKPSQSKLLGKIMLDATINGKDPDKGATTPELDAAWASLDPEFKEIYRKVRDYFHNNLKEMIRDMKMRVIKLPKAERQEAIRKINEQFGPDKLITPYFPLRRFGEYWFQVGKGNFKEFYEFESSVTRNFSRDARIRELQAGNANQRALAKTVDFGDGISELFSKNLASTQILKDVQELIDSIVPPTGVSTKSAQEVRKELQDSLNQLIYIMLPQQSMRKMFINRNAVQGASGDMLRVFTDVAVHSAYQAARFKYSEDFINNINKARDYVKEFYAPNARAKYMDFINELEKRTKTILSAEDKSLLAKAAGTSGTIVFFTMLSSPFTALLNTLGFAVFTGSKLGGKYGYTEASEVMLKNMGRYWLTAPSRTLKPVANAMTQFKPGMVLDMQFPSIVEGGQLSPLMQRAADRFIEEGQINVSLTNDIFDLSDRPSELYTTRYEIIKKILGGLFHQSERANREVALMSAFELEYNKLLNEPKRSTSGFIMRDANGDPITYTPDEAFEAAIEEAKNIAGLTLGDFSRQMKSRLFANVPLSVILKFKQYAVMATYNYIRAAQMFAVPYTKKEIEQIRELFEEQKLSQPEIDRRIEEIVAFKKDIGKQSGKELAGILGVTFLFGGLEAMPFFWIVMPIMAGMLTFGDDDDDDLFDYVNWFRNWASSWLGGMSFARGPVSELLGGSISERVSLDPVSMFYRDGRYSPDLVEGLIQDIIANAGPVVGLGVNIAEAVKLFNEGQYSRSMEKVMPALFAKPLQAYRYGTEGATTRSGEVQMAPEDFSGWMLAMQAIGLQPEKLALRQKSAIQGKEYNAKVLDKEKALLDRLWLERDSSKGFDAAIDNAVEFYERHPTLISEDGSFADKIIKSFETRAEQIAEAEAIGARIDKRLREEIMPMLEYGMPKPVIPKMTLQEVRQKYPQYNNLSDKELSDALKAKGILK